MRSAAIVRGAIGCALLFATYVTGGAASAGTVQPHIIVTPSIRLHNGEIVKVRGAGFKPRDSVFLVECLAIAKGGSQCDTSFKMIVSATINAKGQLPITRFKVRTGKIGSGRCGTTVKNLGACAVSVGNAKGKDTASARIIFVRPAVS